MKNIDKLAKYITVNGAENIIIHTVPGTGNWIVCQKVDKEKWMLTLGAPMGNVTYNLGIVTTEQHLKLWEQLVRLEIEQRASKIKLAEGEVSKKILSTIKKYRITHCYNCKKPLNNSSDNECKKCGWIKCSCGACGCNYDSWELNEEDIL